MVFRPGAIDALPEELDLLGVRRPMVIAGKRAAASAVFKRIIDSPYVQQVRDLQAETGVPRRLRDLGVERDVLPEVAKIVMGERGVYFNPRPVRGPQDVENLLMEAW